MNADHRSFIGASAGGFVALGVAMAFIPVRDTLGNVNVALALAVIVVASGVFGRRLGGAVAASVAALSFAFFHTRPYNELRVTAVRDVITVVLLFVLGVMAGDLSARLQRARRSRADIGQLRRLHRVASRAALGDTTEDLTLQVCAEMIELLTLQDCWYEPAPFLAEVRELARDGALDLRTDQGVGDVGLPDNATSIVIDVRGRIIGRFVLATTPGAPVPNECRLVAFALADQLRVALAAAAA